jgi:hypothetical protein
MARHPGARIVLAVGVVFGVVNTVLFPAAQPEQVALASDLYYAAARAALDGGSFYATPHIFLYPPPVVVAFVPHALLGDPALAWALQTLLNLLALAALAVIAIRTTERLGVDLARVDRALVAAFVVASPPAVLNLVMGQVNPVLALGLAGGAVLLESDRDREAGAALGLVALVKLFPALVGAWLLRRRAWTAIAAATATGLGLLLAGALAFGPATYETYVATVLTGELSVASFPDGTDPTAPYVTVRRQLAVLAPGLTGRALLAASLLVVAPVVVAVNRTVTTLRSRLVALLGTLLAILVAFPLEAFYNVLVLFPLVPLLYAMDGTPGHLVLAGSVLVAVPVAFVDVTYVAGLAVVPPGVGSALRDLARLAFGFALPTSVGIWLVLGGCVLFQHRAATTDDTG